MPRLPAPVLPLLCVGAVLALAGPAWSAPEIAAVPMGDTTLDLSAVGEVEAAPDLASITLGVQVDAPSAAEAVRQNARRMAAVIAVVKAQGLQPKDIQTSNLNVEAQYQYSQNQPAKLTGYRAANTVTVVVRDIARTGDVVDAVAGAGANTISGVAFGFSEPQELEDRARLAAVKALQAKAQLYAGATGLRIVRLVALTEGGEGAPPVMPMRMMARAGPMAKTQVEAGELKVSVSVSGRYDLSR